MNGQPRTFHAAAAAICVAAVYVATLTPGVGYTGDSSKFQYLGSVLGVPHSTGYPTYLVVSHFFTELLPFGSLAFKANLLSALFATAAVFVFFRVLVLVGARPSVALGVSLAFGFTYTFWMTSVVAEVYSLHILFVTLVVHAFLRWRAGGGSRWFYAGWLVYAFSLGNHATSIALLPALVYLVWRTDRGVFRDRRKLAGVAACLLVGGLQYAFVFVRALDPATPYVDVEMHDASDFVHYATLGQFTSVLSFTLADLAAARIPAFFEHLVRECWPLLLLGLAGIRRLRQSGLSGFLAVLFAATAAVATLLDIDDRFIYYVPSYVVVAIFAGAGLEALVAKLPARFAVRPAAVAVVPVLLFTINLSDDHQKLSRQLAHSVESALATARSDAVILSPTYFFSHHLLYYVIGERYDQRNLHVVQHYSPETVRAYLTEGERFYLPEERRHTPPRLRVYCCGGVESKRLELHGLAVHDVGAGLFRVTP